LHGVHLCLGTSDELSSQTAHGYQFYCHAHSDGFPALVARLGVRTL